MVHATPTVKNNIDSEVEVTSWKRKERVVDRVLLLRLDLFFFCLCFLSRTFTNHRTAGEEGGQFFNSSLQVPPASHTHRH